MTRVYSNGQGPSPVTCALHTLEMRSDLNSRFVGLGHHALIKPRESRRIPVLDVNYQTLYNVLSFPPSKIHEKQKRRSARCVPDLLLFLDLYQLQQNELVRPWGKTLTPIAQEVCMRDIFLHQRNNFPLPYYPRDLGPLLR